MEHKIAAGLITYAILTGLIILGSLPVLFEEEITMKKLMWVSLIFTLPLSIGVSLLN